MSRADSLDIMTEFKRFLTDKGFTDRGADEVLYRIENRPDRDDMKLWERYIDQTKKQPG